MALAGGDAVDEGALLVAVGEGEVVGEAPLAANLPGRRWRSANPSRPRLARR